MQKYAKICSDPISISPMHSYAFICTKYAYICKICKHEIYMQNMHSPLCWWLISESSRCSVHCAPEHLAVPPGASRWACAVWLGRAQAACQWAAGPSQPECHRGPWRCYGVPVSSSVTAQRWIRFGGKALDRRRHDSMRGLRVGPAESLQAMMPVRLGFKSSFKW